LIGLAMNGCKGGGSQANPPVLTSLSVTPGEATLETGAALQFTATGTYSDNSTQDVTASVAWASSSAAVAVVGSTGLTTALSAGSATITAAMGTITGDAALTVTDVVSESPFGFHPAGVFKPGYANNGYGDAQDIGVSWAREGVYATCGYLGTSRPRE
jgi:hypothetical protein